MSRILLVLWLLSLGACSTTVAVPVEIKRIEFGVPEPEPLNLDVVTFEIINETNALQILKDIQTNGNPPVLFSLTEENFKNLSRTLEKIQGKLRDYRAYINEMRAYYQDQKNSNPAP